MRPLLLGWLLATPLLAAPAALTVSDGRLTAGGAPLGLFGVSLAESATFWARAQRVSRFEVAVDQIARRGFNLIRVPLNAALLQPAPGVFAGHPEYPVELARRGLDGRYAACLDALVAAAAGQGLYLLFELRELPVDPYRWFTGGDEERRRGDHPGGGIAWMADADALADGLPALCGWLAERWRGEPAIAAFEVPFSPVGGEPEFADEAWLALAADCAAAVKAADPDRLVALAPPGDGSATGDQIAVLTAPLPAGIDLLAPRLHLGPNLPEVRLDDAYAAAPAAWLSWFTGRGLPVLVAEWGPAEGARGWPPRFDPRSDAGQRLHDACLAAWLRHGAAGTVRGGWRQGFDDPLDEGRLLGDAATLAKYGPAYLAGDPPRAEVAIVGSVTRRNADGRRGDLLSLARLLVELGVAPFDTIFAETGLDPATLAGYRALLVYRPGLAQPVLEALREVPVKQLELETTVVDPLRVGAFLQHAGVATQREPYPVWRFDTGARTVLYNWTGLSASVGVELESDRQLGIVEDGELAEAAQGLARVFVPAWSGRELRRLRLDETLAPSEPPDPLEHRLPPLILKLYERGPVRGRWLEPWFGARASLRKIEDGREVIHAGTDGVEPYVAVMFDQHQPVALDTWHRLPGAELQVLLRLVEPSAAVELRCEGRSPSAAVVGALPSRDWQVLSLPLADLEPRGRPELMTGLGIRFIPAGSAEIAAFWLTRPLGE